MGLVLEAFGVDLVDRLGAGRPRGEPAAGGDRLDAADRRAVAGRLVQHLLDLLARQLVALHLRGRQPGQLRFLLGRGGCVDAVGKRLAEFAGQLHIQFAGIPAFARGDLGRQQGRHQAVLVGGPHRAVVAQQRRTGAFLATEAERAIEQALGKPLEADRHFDQFAAQPLRHAVDQRRGDHGLADRGVRAPLRPVPVQVVDQHRQVMVRLHQAVAAGDDAVAVMVGIAGERDVVFVLQADQPLHRVPRRRVHADLAVPVHRHERELRVDHRAHHGKVELVAVGDRLPVMHAGTTQRIDAHLHAGAADRVEVDDMGEVGHIVVEKIVSVRGGGLARLRQRHPLHPLQAAFEQRVGALLHPVGDVGIGRTAVGRVVLEAAVVRWIVRRRDHDAVGQTAVAPPAVMQFVVDQDRVRHRRRGRELAAAGEHRLHTVRRQHFQRTLQRRLRQGMGVRTDEQRAVDALALAVFADRLADRQDVPFVEAALERTAAMTGRAERHPLRGDRRIGLQVDIGGQQFRHVDQDRLRWRLAGERADLLAHGRSVVGWSRS